MFRFRTTMPAMLLFIAITANAASKPERIDAYLKSFHELRQFNGSALIADDGKVLLEKGYGYANFEWEISNTPETKFRLGSITKQFTSMVIMQLVAEGKIDLDARVTTYLPDYRKETGDRITIRHLLDHTSGIPSYTGAPGFRENVSRNRYTPADFVKKFGSGDLEFEPGAKFKYNNSGYFILGAIIEKVTGKGYEQALKERIFDRLGMKNSGYDHSATVLKKRASGYVVQPKGYINAQYLDMSIPYAAGSLYSTARDLYLWDQALYGNELLRDDLKREMFTARVEDYGFGWVIKKLKLHDGRTEVAAVLHGGGIDGFSTLLVRIPERRQLVVLLDNTSRGDKLDELAAGIVSILHDIKPNPPRLSIADAVMSSLEKGGISEAIARYRQLRATKKSDYDFAERELNRLGYQLLQSGRIDDAIEIFKLNVEMYPQAFNPYDSLAEAYLAAGKRDLAITNYRKSVQLNPKSTSGIEALKLLESAPSTTFKLTSPERYVGRYELGPDFVLAIARDGEALTAQATGQGVTHLVAISKTEFSVVGVNARLVFDLPVDGAATALTLHQNGREIKAKRIE